MSRTRTHAWVVTTTSALAVLLFVACGGPSKPSTDPRAEPTVTTTPPTRALRDVEPTAADFVNINTMTRVGDHFVGSLNGHLDAVLAVARDPKGGEYPVGAIIQLVPTEAMVKRRAGYSPSTGDWQFFSLSVSPQGTRIVRSGPVVENFFGGDCASCHALAKAQFDFVCGADHGCAPLPLTDELIAEIQRGDPRPRG